MSTWNFRRSKISVVKFNKSLVTHLCLCSNSLSNGCFCRIALSSPRAKSAVLSRPVVVDPREAPDRACSLAVAGHPGGRLWREGPEDDEIVMN
jgi:hypothetical protein